MEWNRSRVETQNEEVFTGTEMKGLSMRYVTEDRQEQGGVSHSAGVKSIVRQWMLIQWT